MASVEQIKALSALGREMELTGAGLNSFVSDRLSEFTKERESAEREKERSHKMEMERMAIDRELRLSAASRSFVNSDNRSLTKLS